MKNAPWGWGWVGELGIVKVILWIARSHQQTQRQKNIQEFFVCSELSKSFVFVSLCSVMWLLSRKNERKLSFVKNSILTSLTKVVGIREQLKCF